MEVRTEQPLRIVIQMIKKWYFPCIAIVAIIMYAFSHLGVTPHVLLNNYLNDFLCMPIVLTLCQKSIAFVKSDKHIAIPISLQLVLTLLFSIYFEYVLPTTNARYTSDPVDVLLYFIGTVGYIWLKRSTIRYAK